MINYHHKTIVAYKIRFMKQVSFSPRYCLFLVCVGQLISVRFFHLKTKRPLEGACFAWIIIKYIIRLINSG